PRDGTCSIGSRGRSSESRSSVFPVRRLESNALPANVFVGTPWACADRQRRFFPCCRGETSPAPSISSEPALHRAPRKVDSSCTQAPLLGVPLQRNRNIYIGSRSDWCAERTLPRFEYPHLFPPPRRGGEPAPDSIRG